MLQRKTALQTHKPLRAGRKSQERYARTGSALPRTAKHRGRAQQMEGDKEWGRETLSKYAGLCILCERRSKATDPHHCWPKATTGGAEIRHAPRSGVPLCRRHHKQAHAWVWLKRALQQIASEQRRWHYFERTRPITIEEIRMIVAEHRSRRRQMLQGRTNDAEGYGA